MDPVQMKKLEDVYSKWERKSGAGKYGNGSESLADGGSIPGKEAWIQRFGNVPRPLPNRQPPRSARSGRRRGNRQMDDIDFLASATEKQFEVTPAAVPSKYKRDRPFMGDGCPRCHAESSKEFFSPDIPSQGMHNILNMAVYGRENLFRRSFCHILYIYNRKVSKTFADVKKSVTSSPRVQNCIMNSVFQDKAPQGAYVQDFENLERKRQKKITALNKQASGIVSNMASAIYRTLIKFTGWFLFKLFGKLLDGIQFHKGQIEMLQRAAQEGKPMVFLPLHKSHLDYVLVTWILLTCDIKPPHVAAGDNLKNMLVFSWLMRHLGGFFIKRKLDHASGKDDLYKSVLQEYVQQLLKEKEYLEVFIEGSRSRTGKAMVPKSGLLSVVVNSVVEGLVPDVLIVPVNISYEKILETSYPRELLGEAKRPETFWEAVKGIWQVLGTKYGHVRVDFSQPFSLQEFSRCMDNSSIMQEFSSSMAAKASMTSTPLSSLLRNVSDVSIAAMGDDRCFLLTKALGYHVIYDAVQCSAVMSTNILAFLLLYVHREGATLQALTDSFQWLRSEVISRGRDVGFSGETCDVLHHSLDLLRDLVDIETVTQSSVTPATTTDVTKTEGVMQSTVTKVTPKLSPSHIINLVHYSNLVLAVFALESVLACSIVTVARDNDIDIKDIKQEGTLPQSEIVEKAKDLCEILQKEFIFLPPCVSVEAGIKDALEKFITCEVIRCTDESRSTTSRDKDWSLGFSANTWEDDEDDCFGHEIADPLFKLSSSKSQLSRLTFLQALVCPLVESYWIASCGLLWLRGQEFTENEFLSAVHYCAKERVSKDVTMFPESCSLEPLRNALRTFKELGVVELRANEANQTLLRLTNNYEDEEAVFELIDRIHQYKI
ncbi:glycerol-3-phosphate acyltransferase 1, mitochondrial [Nematostella vectensis]|uniref:glycerol-3-phosphate acyltransferase 1, mitochondrial n=1 Tax=Nematostella vectensis TaxID=45351 RepID=UPI0020770E59|nr:glycerol-3-phosphate acyltransferase 1, mitochondrial [Nematostella vectensis]